jgi:uncharacterized protein YigE (DUF2233 family)
MIVPLDITGAADVIGNCCKIGIILMAGCSLMSLAACGSYLPEFIPVPIRAAAPSPTPAPTSTARTRATVTPSLTPSPAIPENWTEVMPGMALRVMPVDVEETPEPVNAILVRIDPARFAFRVHYDPARAATVQRWQERIGGLLVVNGGFFESDNAPVGLLVADGEVFGTSLDQYDEPYSEYGGMFGVVGEAVGIRLLAEAPYQPDEPLDQAVQGFPMLVDNGERPVDFELPGDAARRTAIALDQSGRVLIIVIDSVEISLPDLRDWLVATDELAISAALNLDGGPSTGMALAAGRWRVECQSRARVPSVIEVIPR